jgi:hypothetical protein
VPAMIRRWGLSTSMVFFLLALLLSAEAWIGSYWRYAGVRHNSVRAGGQEVFVGWGSIYAVDGKGGWLAGTPAWHVSSYALNSGLAAVVEGPHASAPYRLLGFAFNPDERSFWGRSTGLLIIPLWFPTVLSALGLLCAWRRKRRIDSTRPGGFEVQLPEPVKSLSRSPPTSRFNDLTLPAA